MRRSSPYLRYLAQLGIAGGILALLLWRVNVGAVRDELSGAVLWWLPIAFFLNLLSDVFRAVRWREFFRPMKKLDVSFLYGVAILGVACNFALPFRAGEFVRLQVLRARTALPTPKVVATLISEKLLDTAAFSAFLVLGILAFDEARYLWPLAVVYGFVLVGGLIVARWLSRRSEGEVPSQPDGGWRLRISRTLHSFGGGLRAFQSSRALVIAAACSLAAWTCEAGMYWAAGQSLGLDLPIAVYLLLVVAATVAVSVPFTQGGLGVFEVALTSLLVAFDVEKSQAAAFAIYAHVILAVPYFVTGPMAAFALRVSPGDVLFFRRAPTSDEPEPQSASA